MLKGSVTIFFSMIIASTMLLIFTMAECIRLYSMADLASMYVDQTSESLFSEYNPLLWQDYRILALDLGYGMENAGTEIMEQKALNYCNYNSNNEAGKSYLRLNANECHIHEYGLLTDHDGSGLIWMGEKAAKVDLPAQALDLIDGRSREIGDLGSTDLESAVADGKESLKNAKEQLANKRQAAPEDYPEPQEVEDNPLDAFDALKNAMSNGLLATIVEDTDDLSEERVDKMTLPSHRVLQRGNLQKDEADGIIDKALFLDYLILNYSTMANPKAHEGLKYELEYIISGQESDVDNLAALAGKILLIREAANYGAIMKNPALQSQAAEMAMALTSFAPEFYEPVKLAVIGAWAYVESTLDLRLLFAGGQVAGVKTIDQWTSSVWSLSSALNVNVKARECANGFSYQDYLLGMMALMPNSILGIRACDVLENALNSTEDYRFVKVDNMVYLANVEMTFSGQEMFLSLLGPYSNIDGNYSIKRERLMSY
ncbi:MAG: DUF5702 domain-containing protein [Pseudobutyrivibrio sp.]|nr:DUF5702 domain-containing protein [Pseudobutyrivibrio sp.]